MIAQWLSGPSYALIRALMDLLNFAGEGRRNRHSKW